MKKYTLVIIAMLSLFTFRTMAQITIADAHLAAIGTSVTVKGIATSGSELGAIRYIQDATGGMAIYGSSLSTINRGDTVTATGTLSNYNNLLEMTPVASFTINSSGNPLPTPQLITPHAFDDSLESELVRIDHASFIAGGGVFAGNTNYNFTSDGFNGQVRIITGSSLVGRLIPIGEVTLIGILSQFCATPASGCTTGYQLLLRDTSDLVILPGIHIISAITESAIATTSFNVNWTTDSAGSSLVKYGRTPALELGVASAAGLTRSHTVTVSGLTSAQIYYVQALSILGADTAMSSNKVFDTRSLSSGDIKVYFNTPVNTSVSTGTDAVTLMNTIDDTLIAYIDRAKYSLDMTIYDFDNSGISNISTAINNAYSRGVRVRFISDGNNVATNLGVADLSPSIPQELSPTGGIYNIMHNKFVVIDANSSNPMDPIVWTGATNWSFGQINNDANNVIIVQDQSLARAYTLEFEEMWGDTGAIANTLNARFGALKTDNTPHEFNINGKRVESYFSPSDGTNAKILQTINSGDNEIEFASMIITRLDLANALASKSGNGVYVYGIVDDQVTTTQWDILLASMGYQRMQDYTPSDIMHNKYIIVDQGNPSSDPTVLTGSHNWSNSADQKNDENTLIVHDATIANIYYQAFYSLFTNNGGIISIPSAIDDVAGSPMIIAYPNPTSNQLFVVSSVMIAQVNLVDMLGKTVISLPENDKKSAIDMSGFTPGMYYLQVVTADKSYTVKCFKN